jgi:hypothetical protein
MRDLRRPTLVPDEQTSLLERCPVTDLRHTIDRYSLFPPSAHQSFTQIRTPFLHGNWAALLYPIDPRHFIVRQLGTVHGEAPTGMRKSDNGSFGLADLGLTNSSLGQTTMTL